MIFFDKTILNNIIFNLFMFDSLQTLIQKAESLGADFVDSRYDSLTLKTVIKENGRITQFKTSKRSGVGFNVYYQGATAYAFSADLNIGALEEAILKALKIAKATAPSVLIKSEIDRKDPQKVNLTHDLKEPSWLVKMEDKLEYLDRMETSAKENAENLSSLILRMGELTGEKFFTNSEGTEIHWIPYLFDIGCTVISKFNGDLMTASDGRGGSVGLEAYNQEGITPEDFGKNAALWAKEKGKAKHAPAGEFRALIGNILGGVLAHESFGHLTEGDILLTKASPLYDKFNQKLGSDNVSIIDEGVLVRSDLIFPCYLPYDDQGIETKKTILMEEGIYKGFLNSRTTAKALGGELTGNSRAVDFTFAPIPRMKNTYFGSGDLNNEDEALKELKRGIYAIDTAGGQVELSGDFLFNAGRAYWVENGEIQYPLRDVSLVGNILDFITRIENATKEIKIIAHFFGGCGKSGQSSLNVGLGGPKLVVDKVRFGGESN
jgi:TldD protein